MSTRPILGSCGRRSERGWTTFLDRLSDQSREGLRHPFCIYRSSSDGAIIAPGEKRLAQAPTPRATLPPRHDRRSIPRQRSRSRDKAPLSDCRDGASLQRGPGGVRTRPAAPAGWSMSPASDAYVRCLQECRIAEAAGPREGASASDFGHEARPRVQRSCARVSATEGCVQFAEDHRRWQPRRADAPRSHARACGLAPAKLEDNRGQTPRQQADSAMGTPWVNSLLAPPDRRFPFGTTFPDGR
jgi:hypothetical protein